MEWCKSRGAGNYGCSVYMGQERKQVSGYKFYVTSCPNYFLVLLRRETCNAIFDATYQQLLRAIYLLWVPYYQLVFATLHHHHHPSLFQFLPHFHSFICILYSDLFSSLFFFNNMILMHDSKKYILFYFQLSAVNYTL